MTSGITARDVQIVRRRTGAGVMACKKALESTGGDPDAAIEKMRKDGQIQAEKKADRTTTQGLIIIKVNLDGNQALILEVNCETDFVAHSDIFKHFVERVAQLALEGQTQSIQSLLKLNYSETTETRQTVEEKRRVLVNKLGENIQLRRLKFIVVPSDVQIGFYVHMGRIGTIVEVKGGDASLSKDLAMHITASNPSVISPKDIPEEVLKKEREIATAQAQVVGKGKPPAVIERIIENRLNKFCDEMSLIKQPFIKDPTLQIGQLLKSNQAEVLRFTRFMVGDGIEKPAEDFAEAVMAQVKASKAPPTCQK